MIISVVGGSGKVGTALSCQLAEAGHSIVIASRDPSSERTQAASKKISARAKLPDSVSALAIREACEKAQAVLLTTPLAGIGAPITELAESMGPCARKTLIDCTNPLSPWPALELTLDRNTTSATEEFARVFPQSAGVYKAFNSVGVEVLANPIMADKVPAVMMYAGPPKEEAPDAYDTVTRIVADTQFEPLYVGPHRQARNLEAVAELWIHMATRYKLPFHEAHPANAFAWKVLHK